MHALVLLAHFHSLSSFVFGSGINDEPRYYQEDESTGAGEPILTLDPPPHSSGARTSAVKLEEEKGEFFLQ